MDMFPWLDPTSLPEPPESVDPYREAAKKYRPLGFQAVFEDSDFIGSQTLRIKYYMCRRGCGGLVWSPEDHMKNVCTEFNPIIGE